LFAVVPAGTTILLRQFVAANPGSTDLILLSPYLQLPFIAAYAAFVTRQTLSHILRDPETVSESLMGTLRVFAPLLALQVLILLATILGIVLLVVPGILVTLAWSVAAPARISEPLSIIGALRRSAELTKGNRPRIFGLFLLYFASALVLSLLSRMFGFVFGGSSGLLTAGGSPVAIVFASLIGSVERLVVIVGAATLYLALRKAKEGAVEAEVARVFA